MKNILSFILLLVAFSSNAQRTFFQVNNNYIGPVGASISATNGLSYLTSNSGQSGGTIASDGGNAITAKGVVWSTSSGPTVALSTKTNDGTGLGAFTSTLTGLTLYTVYYIRSYATNSIGTSYGPEVSIAFINTVTSATGKIWMDRNLGATQAATSSTDAASIGDLYQWGRGADGHQILNSLLTTTKFSSTTTNSNKFASGESMYDWLVNSDPNLWQGVNGVNNPCPVGFRIPTKQEWTNEYATWSSLDATGAFASPLKLPNVSKFRNFAGGGYIPSTYYWSSSISQTPNARVSQKSYTLFMSSSAVAWMEYERGYGFSCRCIQD
jgi:uncharacterized protein (TIGR02145 family)